MSNAKKTLFGDKKDEGVAGFDSDILQRKNKLFSGKNGRILFELQKSYKGDSRFKLDERFIELDKEKLPERLFLNFDKEEDISVDLEGEGNDIDMDLEKEKYGYYRVMEKVLGIELNRPKKKKATGGIMRFDPSKLSSEDLIVKAKPIEKPKEPVKIKEKPQKKKKIKIKTSKKIKKARRLDINYSALKETAENKEEIKSFKLFG